MRIAAAGLRALRGGAGAVGSPRCLPWLPRTGTGTRLAGGGLADTRAANTMLLTATTAALLAAGGGDLHSAGRRRTPPRAN
ncbi:hypothetical protein [Streptomyces sp. NPDC048496]|uniref:hypothetical protein n=1 Tax=Streptomyces sp. NPDC048496 TaxID=3365558 RepID=UPI003714DD14